MSDDRSTGGAGDTFVVRPIGVFRGPYREAVEAPRQAATAPDVPGRIELSPRPGFEHAVEDLEGWDYLWILFWFDRAEGFRPKVLPPRSTERRGLFATRSPHRPNPIGLSAVRLVAVSGLTLHVTGVDILDGTPVVDVKPYVPYADAYPNARTGWLQPAPDDRVPEGERPADPLSVWHVVYEPKARAQLDFLRPHHVDLEEAITRALRLGPQPHPYRRIKRVGDESRLAVKDWRAFFTIHGHEVRVSRLISGYRPAELATNEAPPVHVAFADLFGI